MKSSLPAHGSVRSIAYVAMGVAILTVCAWLTVPFAINFTMQTFAVFLIAFLYSLKNSIFTFLSYLFLGMIGVPVFSGFQGGYVVLLGPTGGYLIGFLFLFLLISWGKHRFGGHRLFLSLFALIGLALCYTFGTAWYLWIYSPSESTSLFSVLSLCVFPFIVPDIAKLFLAFTVARRLKFLISAQ